MPYTLASAATATGLSSKTILRAIKAGNITATKDEFGEWHIEPAALHRVFPAVSEPAGDGGPPYSETDIEALGAQIEALVRQAGARLRQQLADVRRGCETEPGRAAHPQLVDQHEPIR
jgi:hypothetical protein